MQLLHLLLTICALVLPIAAASSKTITIYAWPLSASAPKPYADVSISSTGGSAVYLAELLSDPKAPSVTDEPVRIGLYDPSTKAWRGSVASGAVFGQKVDRKLRVHVDRKGEVYHVGLETDEIPNPSKLKFNLKKSDKKGREAAKQAKKAEWRDGVTSVEVVPQDDAPVPFLNKPVVLTPDGKVDAPAGEEKTFLQKYVCHLY
jgi:hypothetical protein